MRRNIRSMHLEFFHGTLTIAVLWTCLNPGVGWPLQGNTAAVLLPTKYLKSSAVTPMSSVPTEPKVVRASESNRSPAVVGVHSYRLPPSPANLLKPDGFQFYTYNERGEMITKQMTMQDIQSLIASGGPDHSMVGIQEPQKAEDILTGGKKVMDVVEKVQNVLKSAMDKPPSTLTVSHPMIPEKASAEWSNILPAILAGDKYGNKVEETHHVEEATSKPLSSSTVPNHVTYGAISSTPTEKLENVTEEGQQSDGTIIKSDKNETRTVSSTITPETSTTSYTEKLMIPVSVITTEQNIEEIIQRTTQSPIFHKTTQVATSSESTTREQYDHDKEKDKIDTFIPSSVESTTNNSNNVDRTSENYSSSVDVVTHRIDLLTTQMKMKPVTVNTTPKENVEVSPDMQTVSLMESSQTQSSVTNEPFATSSTQFPASSAVTGASKYSTSVSIESSSTQDTVTKINDVGTTESITPLSLELINSLSSMVNQVSENISSILPMNSVFRPTVSENENEMYNKNSEVTLSEVHTITVPSTTSEDFPDNLKDDTLQKRTEELIVETTAKSKIDQEEISSTTSSSNLTDLEKTTNYSDEPSMQTESVHTDVQLNGTKATAMVNETLSNSNSSEWMTIIESMLQTASTEANTASTMLLTLPSTLPENMSANTLASALIAGFNLPNLNKTESVSQESTTASNKELNVTDTTSNTKISVLETGNMNDTKKEVEIENVTAKSEDLVTEDVSHKEATTLETTDRTLVTGTSIETSTIEQNGSLITFEPTTTASSSVSDEVTKSTDASVMSTAFMEHTIVPISEAVTKSSNESTSVSVERATSSPSLNSQKSEEGSKLRIETTEIVTTEISSSTEGVSQEVSQKDDKTSVTYLDNTTEASSTERDAEITAYNATTVSDELLIRRSELANSTVIKNSSSTEEHVAEKQHKIDEPLDNMKNRTIEDSLKETDELQGNRTVYTSNTTLTSLNDTKLFVVTTIDAPEVSFEDKSRLSLDTTTTPNPIQKDTMDNLKDTSSATSTMTPMISDKSENKAKVSNESLHGVSSANNTMVTQSLSSSHNKSKINEKFDTSERQPTLQNKANRTNTSPEHTWQRIPLHQASPLSTTTKKEDVPASTVSTTLETNPTVTEMQHPSTPATETGFTVSLNASKTVGGLDTSTRNASSDVVNFSRLCNELAIEFWIAANKGLSTGRSLILSPFGMTSLLAMVFLGARGATSDQMNEVLGLDNFATFNPHLVFQNVTDTVSLARNQGVANAAFVRELFADKAKVRKLLPFYKEQAQQFYEGLVAEVNFATISDLARRRTNLLIRKQTGGRIKDFVKSNAVPLRSPLAGISANVFQTDCNTSAASTMGRDGELYFAVSSVHRLRKLIPVPAIVWRSNILAGYEPSLDATAVALGGVDKIVSTVFILPGQQGHVAPGDTLDRLEQRLTNGAFRDGSWDKLLKVLIPRPGLEVQIPKFSHRSVVNATAALKRMGLDQLFSSHADFKGINGIGNRLFLSDVLQMNLFSTCGDENISNGRHLVEIYPASPSIRSAQHNELLSNEKLALDRIARTVDMQSKRYRTISTDRRRNHERSEDKPRLKLDQPFLYFVRHNPTSLILHMGRFNPRLI
ncbi:uncharacterized protein LOC143428263 [Xylocopa sonorina]|uniref:uncharacterized protein LOC143428263 n=1 Tax=Xylocopa sonorina TaxID=1818115 RepID=UPI00403B00A9